MSGLDEESQGKQVKMLTLCFSCETLTIVNNLGLTVEHRESVTSIVEAMQGYVEGTINYSVQYFHELPFNSNNFVHVSPRASP